MRTAGIALVLGLSLVAGLPCLCNRLEEKAPAKSCCCGESEAQDAPMNESSCCCTKLAKADLSLDLPAMDAMMDAVGYAGEPPEPPATAVQRPSDTWGPDPPPDPLLFFRTGALLL